MLRHIFVDLDGVLVDFASAACLAHGRRDFTVNDFRDWPPGEWSMAKVFGVTEDEFWRVIDDHDTDFWCDLEPYPWMRELVVMLPAPFTIATSPSRDPACAYGKVWWMREHFGKRFRDFLIGQQKHLLARHDTLLIDDNDKKCREFGEAGGMAILFPQPWNANHALVGDRLGYIRECLKAATA